jgi:pimeloyl-ACP methyl ester carboxylesterase
MNSIRFIVTRLCLLIALLLIALPARAEAVKARRVTFPVTLSDNQVYSIAGYLYCSTSCERRTLQLLVHGATYNHLYWDAPVISDHEYSYARHMAQEGYAVLAIDQLGVGESDKPDGDMLTVQEAASGLHQVMSQLRTRQNPLRHRFEKIVLVGHSLGSLTAVYAEGIYGDADGLVVTGFAVTPHPILYNAETIAALFSSPYGTFPPEVRAFAFYHFPSADPDMINYDNMFMKDVVARGELLSTLPFAADPSLIGSASITEPVLVQLGDWDLTAPAALAPFEAASYPSAESITVKTLEDMGHAFNLHLNNKQSFAQIERWIESTVDHE